MNIDWFFIVNVGVKCLFFDIDFVVLKKKYSVFVGVRLVFSNVGGY